MSDAMTNLREAARNLSGQYDTISTPMLYAALGVGSEDQQERDRIRRRCNQMVKTGELVRVKPGSYKYNADAAPARHGEFMTRIIRAMKSASKPFTQQDIARVSGATLSHVSRYMKFLVEDGYVRPHGKRGLSSLYRCTQKLRAEMNAPLPPRPLNDPFETERAYVHELVGLFLLRDPYRPDVQRKIVKCCDAIRERFVTQDEKGEIDG